ncbi:MAG: gamma-glutamyl-gamma-aminobutyrate hydrolase family protein [Candidatus Obscuribacterales bacterium]|nr:gamma-glutamyl-gamma-aminobutyrate hydrolase family protein [Candidatus Obscuribacterales bacterium]
MAMKKDLQPLIGLNMDVAGVAPKEASVQANYYEAVQKAGGLPLMIPPSLEGSEISALLKRLDGVVFIGGSDYCPSYYKQETHVSNKLLPQERMNFDLLFLQKLVNETTLPYLGICAGMQALNIALGGSLIQHIPEAVPNSQIQHSSPEGWKKGFNKHLVKLAPGSQLKEIYELAEIDVVTSHHQSVDKLGEGLVNAAYAEDGIIEAVELEERFVIGVQWHPERDWETNQKLFAEFVRQAAKYAECSP